MIFWGLNPFATWRLNFHPVRREKTIDYWHFALAYTIRKIKVQLMYKTLLFCHSLSSLVIHVFYTFERIRYFNSRLKSGTYLWNFKNSATNFWGGGKMDSQATKPYCTRIFFANPVFIHWEKVDGLKIGFFGTLPSKKMGPQATKPHCTRAPFEAAVQDPL